MGTTNTPRSERSEVWSAARESLNSGLYFLAAAACAAVIIGLLCSLFNVAGETTQVVEVRPIGLGNVASLAPQTQLYRGNPYALAVRDVEGFAVGSSEGLWVYRDAEGLPSRLLTYAEPVRLLTYSPDETQLAYLSESGMLHVISTEDGTTLFLREIGEAEALIYAPDGAHMVAGLPDGRILLIALNMEVP